MEQNECRVYGVERCGTVPVSVFGSSFLTVPVSVPVLESSFLTVPVSVPVL